MTKQPIDNPPAVSPADEYFLEIESHFAERRGTPFILSAKDWALMKSWREGGIPLPVVLEAIDVCFDKRDERRRRGTISSLSYCRHAVAELWDERKDLQIGAGESIPEQDPPGQLERIASLLRETATRFPSLAERLDAASEDVRAAASQGSVPQIERRLIEIEHALLPDLLALMPHESRRQLESEVKTILAGYASLDESIIRKTREANLFRLLRRSLDLPRLSLFG